jgi:hypothetical protein
MSSHGVCGRVLVVALVVFVLALCLVPLAGCGGPKDAFAGTWVEAADSSSQMIIAKNADGSYTIKDPDGSHAWTSTPAGNVLKGTVAATPPGSTESVNVDISVTITGETGKLTVTYQGASQSYDIKRK